MFQIPFRQKAFLLTVVLLGALICAAFALRLLTQESLRVLLFFYGMGIPFFLLASDLLADLDDIKVLTWWLGIGVIFLVAFLLLRNNHDLIMRPARSDDRKYYRWIGNSAADPLKCLPLFLIAYRMLNYVSKITRGKALVSTYKLNKWYSDVALRKVDWVDVFFNVLLFLIIFGSVFIKI